jgi:hypothetical protein
MTAPAPPFGLIFRRKLLSTRPENALVQGARRVVGITAGTAAEFMMEV